MSKSSLGLSQSARKALQVHVGDAAGTEIANLIQRMALQIEELKRSKVSITPVVPSSRREKVRSIEEETF